jgi:hypothetical protein
MEVFYPDSIRDKACAFKVEVTLRPTVSRPVHLGRSRSQSQSHITTDNQSASPSWCQVKVEVTLLPMVSRPVRLGVLPRLEQ